MDYLSSLNSAQRAAVTHGMGPMLVLAGAGSGKTRVLTHRMAHLVYGHKVDPSQIFAVTFTNKAAGEMRERVGRLLGRDFSSVYGNDSMWVSTFHSACVRILRSDIHHLGYDNQFTIYDDQDQLSVIKACLKELNLSESTFSPKAIQAKINKVKNDGREASSYESQFGGPYEDAFVRVFIRYTEALKASSALDFGDLILQTVKLFREQARLLKSYQERFPFVLIDEYQDTNRCQYLLMKQLAGDAANIAAVGDEDQSIYKWRGADISNILNFEKDYPNATIYKLEENYRSTKNIIEAASHVIAYNTERRDKQLWTQNPEGEKIQLLECYDEHDEANKVTAEVLNSVSEGVSLDDSAIFYRTNAQSRVIEDMLRAKGINYQIFGGLKFYERLEVKDALAYLKLLANPKDDVSFRRIINVPARGIGAVSLERFASAARKLGLTHYEFLQRWMEDRTLAEVGRSGKNFEKFFALMQALGQEKKRLLPSDLLNAVLEESGYRESLVKENTIESQARLENLAELRQAVVEFELRCGADNPEKPIQLEGFLEQIALVSQADTPNADIASVKLMTIHMAKGLEFDRVYITGLEEELFPNIRSWEAEDDSDVEEERRLCYVAMTRARQRLFLLYAKNRTVFGTTHFRVRSRFVDEIPESYLVLKKADYFSRRRPYLDKPGLPGRKNEDEEFDQQNYTDDVYEEAYTESYEEEGVPKPGSRVVHPIFGQGIVRRHLGEDKLMVEFAGRGVKKISLKFTQLKSD